MAQWCPNAVPPCELRRVNQLGGFFVIGCPLPDAKRKKIVELALCGLRAADISHQLKVSSGCVSKILTRYYKVGLVQPKTREGSRPQIATPQLVAVIAQLKQERPSLFAWEIREKLEAAGTCTASGIPSISSINRILRRLEAPGGSPFLRKLPQPGAPSLDAHPPPLPPALGEQPGGPEATTFSATVPEKESWQGESRFTLQIPARMAYTGPFLAGEGERRDLAEAPTSPSSLQSVGVTGLPRTRSRTVFSKEQLQVLESAFQRSQYPEAAARAELAGESGLPEATLKVWFSNRRARWRREALRAQHAGSGPATPGSYLAWGCV